jgi:hypothetical protein
MSDVNTSQQTTEQPGTEGAAIATQQSSQTTQGSATTTEGTAGAGETQQTAQTAQTTEEGEGTAQERDDKGRFKGVQPRIDELTRRRHEAEREAAYWRSVAQQGSAQQSASAAPEKPTPDKYDNYADFVEALADWKADQKVKTAFAEQGAKSAQQTAQDTFSGRVAAFTKTAPDYVDVVGNSDVPVANHVAEHILDSDVGPQIAYHLAKNPDQAHRLNAMSPTAAAREIGRIEATLAKPQSAGDPPPSAKKLTETPAPPNTSHSGQGRAVTPEIGNLPMKDYLAARAKQGARWAR